ncbi:MAG TPA: FAD-dependent oxidoreductase [Bryobacteraceae bacterium]|nr:FAD-dependent oxidoreductase [Bryobacteraceae bacterium]
MAKPVLLTVDDDPDVLRAIERDLRSRFSEHYRVIRADSGQAALETLRQLKTRSAPVSLLLADQRMPHMSGVEFLHQAMAIYPDAKRALLTAYADTDAAIQAINEVKIDHFLLKPWDPPENELYPVLDDLLEDWQANYHPPFEGTRVLGNRWDARSYELRDFLARHHIPYQWIDVELAASDPEVAQLMAALAGEPLRLPVVLLKEGTRLDQPNTTQLAEQLHLHTTAESDQYDLIIIGGGPAGLAAAVYGASEGLRTVMVEREAPGGQAALSSRIENYLGFPSGLSGSDLARRAVTQARRFGVEILSPLEAMSVRLDGQYKFVSLSSGAEISCHALLIATGVRWRKLEVPGADRFLDCGMYYGATPAEAVSCKDEDVYVVGGANSAGQAAMNFSKYARRVVMLVRGDSLAATMSSYLIDQIKQTPNITVEYNTRVISVQGEERLERITVECGASGQQDTVATSALFIFIGATPDTDWLDGVMERDERGFVLTGRDLVRKPETRKKWPLEREPWLMESSVPGIFVVGDVRHGSVKRVASGVGEGSIAVQFIHQYLSQV